MFIPRVIGHEHVFYLHEDCMPIYHAMYHAYFVLCTLCGVGLCMHSASTMFPLSSPIVKFYDRQPGAVR